MADDDLDDRHMAGHALRSEHLVDTFITVTNGDDLMDDRYRRGRFEREDAAPTPSVVLLDLNMPKKSGREALVEIKRDESLRHMPILIFSTSTANEDVVASYRLGANSYIRKPDAYEGFVGSLRRRQYWHDAIEASF